MRKFSALLLVSLLACTRQLPPDGAKAPAGTNADTLAVPDTPQAGRSPELARRADSLDALVPATEVAGALARRDFRLVGVCSFACLAPGLPEGVDQPPRDSLLVIVGTTDAITNADVARLNQSADRYARAYNRLMLERHPRG